MLPLLTFVLAALRARLRRRTHLVTGDLLLRHQMGQARYRLLETRRAYSWERLTERG